MLDFKPIELEDKKEIDRCLANNTYRACDYCFTNLYAWQAKFNTTFAIAQKTLFVRFLGADGCFYYMMPMGKMELQSALNLIIEDAKMKNLCFGMKGITLRMWNAINEVAPDFFNSLHDVNNDEYVYLSENLISLRGKKLQSKRNHINRFKKENSNWLYFPLTTAEDFSECKQMLREWEEANEEKMETGLEYDDIATQIMLDNFDTLGLKGGAIRVNGKMIAFSIGEALTEDTFVVHVEKAFAGMNGGYAIINQQFAEHEAEGFKYINREEDLGIESLRRAKHSYQPEFILEERILCLK